VRGGGGAQRGLCLLAELVHVLGERRQARLDARVAVRLHVRRVLLAGALLAVAL
jgi:hypothetical protein